LPGALAATDLAAEVAAGLDRLGPYEPQPAIAIGASGGADSTALTLLAARWVCARGGTLRALIVDHRLRVKSTEEAQTTASRLAALGIPTEILTLHDLHSGPSLAARARDARLAALTEACRARGIAHLLLGHHQADQEETHLMRARAGSGPAGLAGMTALRELPDLRLLRPLLGIASARLREFLRHQGVQWIEDPTNHDQRTTRARLRAELAAKGAPSFQAATASASQHRQASEEATAAELAQRVRFSPLGYAWLSPGPLSPPALAALLRVIGGSAYPPRGAALLRLAADPAPATLAGVRLLRARAGLLLVREHPVPPVPAENFAVWDRFRLRATGLPRGLFIAALGGARPIASRLPAAVLRVLPALWEGRPGALPLDPAGGSAAKPASTLPEPPACLIAAPPLDWPRPPVWSAKFTFLPPAPACGASWLET
jgi:tRNA(Ile)-lysidine synthase